MASGTASSPPSSFSTLRAILWGGLACGTLDISAAFLFYGLLGLHPLRLLQGIASGILGPRAFAMGYAAAALGLLCHFVIACGAATAYVLASRSIAFLTRRPFLAGPLYGVAVYFLMQFVVLLSRTARHPFTLQLTLLGIAIHIVCVGTPIALVAHRFAPRPAAAA